MNFITVLCLVLGAGVLSWAIVEGPFLLLEWLTEKGSEK